MFYFYICIPYTKSAIIRDPSVLLLLLHNNLSIGSESLTSRVSTLLPSVTCIRRYLMPLCRYVKCKEENDKLMFRFADEREDGTMLRESLRMRAHSFH